MLSSFETLYSRLEHCNYKCWAKSLSRYISKCYIYNSSYAFFQNWDFQTFKELSKWGVWLNRDWSLKADTQKTAPMALGWPLWQQFCEQRKETGLWHSKLWFMKTVPPLLKQSCWPPWVLSEPHKIRTYQAQGWRDPMQHFHQHFCSGIISLTVYYFFVFSKDTKKALGITQV